MYMRSSGDCCYENEGIAHASWLHASLILKESTT